ncbi:hypothetical protein OHA25_31925 [Nonomuraea sp. NBC_00507]|uniref:hypothetical protein n=1 Tax=unclassified Nonomuraea TaxID=2593643 RepID=UPI00273B34FA|nr:MULTISPECIES: hypothetical protein [unclassified Nonomuraea]MDP4507008.1 hypothetical protein [Nonomuraea sp. G32]
MFRLRRWLGYAAIAFVVFYLFTRPAQAADAVNGVFDGVLAGADKLAIFFSAVLT